MITIKLTMEEATFLYNVLDQISPRGLIAKTAQVEIMKKMAVELGVDGQPPKQENTDGDK